MSLQRLKVGDKVKCCGIIGHSYLDDYPENKGGKTATLLLPEDY